MLILPLALAFAAPARALAPDRVAWVTAPGLTGATDLSISPDGLSLLLADPGGGAMGVLDLRSWKLSTVAPCGGATGAAAWDNGGTVQVYAGCEDGTVTWATLGDGDLSLSGEVIDVADGPVLGIVQDADILYVVTDPVDGSNPTLHSIDPTTGTIDGVSSMPLVLGHSGFVDMELAGTYLVVLHGGDNLSKVYLTAPSSSGETNSLGTLTGRDLVVSSSGNVVFAGGGSAVGRFALGDNSWYATLGTGDGLEDVDGLGLLETDGLMLVADGGAQLLKTFLWTANAETVGNVVQDGFDYPTVAATVAEVVTTGDYTIAGTAEGELWVLTAAPWVEVTEVKPSSALSGDTVQLGFTSDEAGSYEVRLGADTDTGGTVVASGSIAADATETVDLAVDDSYVEGANQLRVVVTGSNGAAGHDAGLVSVDNPPTQVALADSDVGIGNGYLKLSFTAPSDADLARIQVFVSTTAFSASDWPEGGPAFDGTDALDTSALDFAVTPGEAVELVISPLTNDQIYYLAARATDVGGLEGPMSTVVSGTPSETFAVSQLAGEQGGFCGTPGSASLALAALGLGLAAARRRRWGLLGGGVLLAALVVAAPARADDGAADGSTPSTSAPPSEHYTAVQYGIVQVSDKIKGGTDLRFGPMWFANGNAITDVLGDSGHNVLWLETGPSVGRMLQFSVGGGFYRKRGTLLTASGVASEQTDTLYAVPLTANATLRLDVLKNQPLVPYVTGGGDMWLWHEGWAIDAAGTKTSMGGGKWGYHYGVGGQLLLDIFEPDRAQMAEARLHIKDTYLTGEWRRQEVGVFQKGIDLSNSQVTFGIKVLY